MLLSQSRFILEHLGLDAHRNACGCGYVVLRNTPEFVAAEQVTAVLGLIRPHMLMSLQALQTMRDNHAACSAAFMVLDAPMQSAFVWVGTNGLQTATSNTHARLRLKACQLHTAAANYCMCMKDDPP